MSSFEWVQLSPDGSAGWCGRRKHQVVSHRDHLYLLGGYAAEANISRNLNDIWRSSNGKNWSQIVSHAPWSGRDGHAALEHLGYIYLMGGTQDVHSNDDDVWRSSNAINWVQLCRSAGWEGRWQHAAVSHDGSIYLMGGWSAESDYMDDIWRSTDGTRWTCICHHAEWGPRMFHVLVSLNGAIYLMGGAHRSTYNDVWVSTDGCSWQRLIREAQWCPRTGHAAVVHENHIFLCGGGAPDGTTLNDMWHSMDGAHWSVVTTGPNSAIWTPRRGHAVVSHSNSIFIFGGCSAMVDVNDENQGERQYMNDCYRTLTDIELLWSSEEAEYRDQTGRVDVVLAPVNESSLVENRGLGSAIIGSALPPGTTSSIKVGARQGNLGINNITVGMRTVVDGVSALMQRRKELRNVQLTTLKIAKRTEDAILLAFPEIEATDNAESTLEDLNSLETSVSALRSFVEQKRQELKDIHCKIRGTVKDWKNVDVVDLLIEQRTEIAKISLPHIEKLAGCMNDVVLRQNESHAFLEEAIIYLEEVAKTLGGEVWVKIQRLLGNDSSALPVITNKKDLSLHYKELIESIKDDSMEPLNRKTDEALNQLTISAKDVSKSLSEVTAWIECVNEGEMLSIGSAAELDEAERVLSQVRLEAHWQVDSELHSIPHLLERKKELNMDLMVTAHQHLTALLTCAKARTSELDLQAQNLASWANLVRQWADADGLAQKCKDLIERIQSTKERLLDLEDKAQDCRSNMHKRRRRDAPADEISQLQLDLKHAQLAVAYAQRLKRRLASEISALAHSTAPEIAVQVPDAINFLSRTTQEIEGVSVSGLGLPIRSLSEYENIKPMDESENRTRGRHQMFTATLDDEKVALKCYALVGSGERRALERELSILARIRHGAIIRANALIEAPNLLMEDGAVPVMYIEFPYCAQGSLKTWISASRREQWEIQSIFRQVLCGVMYLHEKCVIHKDIKPENILLHADGRVLLADFDISRDAPDDSADTFQPVSTNTSMRGGGTRGFMAPEVEAGGTATRASDMYSLGCVLFWMHFPDHPTGPIAGTHIRAPAREAPAVAALELMHQLLSVDPSRRPGASDALLHSYFRISFVDRLLEEGAVPGQHAKLSAVRALFARIRDDSQHENIVRWSIRRGLLTLVQDVFLSLERMYGSYLRRPIKVTFEGEAGVDEGGMFNETMTLFFQGILHPHFELFESSESGQVNSEAENNGAFRAYSSRYLPTPREECSDTALKYYYLIGQAISLCLYRGNRIGEAFASSLFRYLAGDRPSAATLGDLEQWDSATAAGLQWLLACKSVAVKGLKLSFDDIGLPGGAVTSENRLQYVQAKIQKMLVESRESALSAIRAGTISSLTALSPEAPDLMNLLGPADWRVLLCGEAHISGAQVASAITYNGFPHQSGILQWLPALVQSLNEDTLRQFLVFVCGSPSLPAEGSITVRCQPSSPALPVAHTCFMHLDLPDYPSEGVLRYKLLQAISESGTFDIV